MSTLIKQIDIENIVTSIGSPGTDDNLPTEKAVRDAIVAGGGGDLPEIINTYKAGENILSNRHVCLLGFFDSQMSRNTSINQITGSDTTPVNMNIGHSFTTQQEVKLYGFEVSFSYGKNTSASATFTGQAKLYAATGTVGVNAVPTGAALAVSDTFTFTESATSGGREMRFNFQGETIPQGDFCISIELLATSAGLFNAVRLRAGSGGQHYGNSYRNTTSVTPEIYFKLRTSGYVRLADATNISTSRYLGISTESKNTGEDIAIKERGIVVQTGATGEGEIWYLSNVAGEISTTPGTNLVFVGKGHSNNNIQIRGLDDINGKKFSSRVLIQKNGPNIPSGTLFFASGGGLLMQKMLNVFGGGTPNIITEVSLDGLVRNMVSGNLPLYEKSELINKDLFVRFFYSSGNNLDYAQFDYEFIPF